MGFLGVATPMPWEQAKKWLKHVRKHGVEQFLKTWHNHKMIEGDTLKFGDEIEYMLIRLDHLNRMPLLSLRADPILKELTLREESVKNSLTLQCTWHPEYCSYMVEGTPSGAYHGFDDDLARVESNMRLRRARIKQVLQEDEVVLSMVSFPLLGVAGNFTSPPSTPNGPIAASTMVSDDCINPHPRFHTMTKNIRMRRKRNVDIRIPTFMDSCTKVDDTGKAPDIHMDCQAFGMGCCCLQVTFQARDMHESRHLYDQLAVLSPIALALTAASPIYKGTLADIDVRWKVIAGSVDDRTEEEMGLKPRGEPDEFISGGGQLPLAKSRYESISSYICNCGGGADPNTATSQYNDVHLEYDKEIYQRLMEAGMDDLVAKHVAYNFIRDPLILFEERIHLDDDADTDHFENLHSTNWNTVRWKPPPPNTDIGWRTEFRPMEVQLTDFENAAFTVFSVLVSRVILAFDLNLYMPISLVDQNMDRAHARDATQTQRFWWRRHFAPPAHTDCKADRPHCCEIHSNYNSYEEMTLLEILSGKGKYFPGLLPMIQAYLDTIGLDLEVRKQVDSYLCFIHGRASGEILTTAQWMRNFVTKHPDYKKDSVVTSTIAYDLVKECQQIAEGLKACPELLGNNIVAPLPSKNQLYNKPLETASLRGHGHADVKDLISRYAERAESANKKRRLTREILEKEQELATLRAEFASAIGVPGDPILAS